MAEAPESLDSMAEALTQPRSSAALALTVLQQLHAEGVRDIVLSPGSRSAPLALALHAADAAGDLRLHVRIDERSAAFLALGLSIGSRRPVAVVVTSGTAVGNLVPAVMEAHHSGRRVIVLSADRPARLRGTGANQTTEQAGLFGEFAPCVELTQASSAAQIASAVVRACRGRGPSQLNLQFDGDLLPGADAAWWQPAHERHRGGEPERHPDLSDAMILEPGPRTVVVAGDDAGPAARILAEKANWPLLAEPTSGARVGSHAIQTYRLLLGTALGDQIERVVVLGHPTLSRPVSALLSDPRREVIAVRGRAGVATDPARIARHVDLVPRVTHGDDTTWLDLWRAADALLTARVGAHVDAQPFGPLTVAREVAAAVIAGASLIVGSSNPVRDLDIMATPWTPHEHRFVVGNRGLAGIDGVVSTAIGVSLGRDRASRSIAVLGDVTFLHDANGLTIGPDEPRPDLTIVVLNDDGGAIFAGLEQGADAYRAAFERVFATPHGSDLAALCLAHGVAHELVENAERLRALLSEEASGIRVLECRVSRADRRDQAALLREFATQL